MATEDIDVSDSDELFNHLCLVCKKDETLTEATIYCEDCKDYYCGKCVDFHKTIPALYDHVLVTVSHGGKLPSLQTSRCDKHTKNIIDIYCQDHDEVGCIDCINSWYHRKCRNLHDIPDFVKDNKNIVSEFIQEVEIIKGKLKARLDLFHQEQTELQQNKTDVIDNIEASCDRLVNIIRQQAEDATQNVESKYAELNNDLKAKVTDLNFKVDQIEELLKGVRSVSHNVPEVFILSKKSKEAVSKIESLNNDVELAVLGKRLAFDLDIFHETVLKWELFDPGNALVTPCLYRFRKIKGINLGYGASSDLCCTNDGSVFFTHYNNKLLHRICSKTLNVLETLELPSSPRVVCCVSNTKIAVGLGKTIRMIDITGELKLTDTIKVHHDICGLYYHDHIFYVTSCDCVYRYDRNGELLEPFSKYADGNSIFSFINNLVVNPLNKNIHIADSNNGIITMNQKGHVLNVVKDNISGPDGICVDQYGQVFVSGGWSDNIIQLNCDGRYITTVIDEGLYGPQGICFDTTRGRFYIGGLPIQVNEVETVNN